MTVEFVGPPAAGKSALCNALVELLSADGCGATASSPVDDRRRAAVRLTKLADVARFSLAHPATVRALSVVVRRSRQRDRRQAVAKTVSLISELRREGAAGSPQVVEQGVLQAIWSVGLEAAKPPLQELLQHCREWLPHTVVLVDVDRAEILRRLEERDNGRSRLDELNHQHAGGILQRGDQLMGRLLDLWLGLDPHHRVIRVGNERGVDPADALEPEYERIKQRMASSPSPGWTYG